LWKKHGAAPRVWTVSVGEIGNTAFSAEFKSYADYAKVMESLTADPDFRAWQAKSQESGTSEWVRSQSLLMASIKVSTTSVTTLRAKGTVAPPSSRLFRNLQIAPRVVTRSRVQSW
jgi:hypothetical protein